MAGCAPLYDSSDARLSMRGSGFLSGGVVMFFSSSSRDLGEREEAGTREVDLCIR